MWLTNDVTINTRKTWSDVVNVYFRIPRSPDQWFFDQYGRKHINFDIEMRDDYDTRLEQPEYSEDGVMINPWKKPIRVIQFRAVNATHEEVFGRPWVPAQFDGEWNRIAEAIPAIEWVNNSANPDMFTAPYDEVYDEDAIDDYVVEHAKDIEEWKKIGRYEATARAYVWQTYEYIKTLTDFCGMDMTTALDHP